MACTAAGALDSGELRAVDDPRGRQSCLCDYPACWSGKVPAYDEFWSLGCFWKLVRLNETEADPKYNNFILRWLLSKCSYKISWYIHCFWLSLDDVLFVSPCTCPDGRGTCFMEISQTTLVSWLRVQESQLGNFAKVGLESDWKAGFKYYIATNYR